MRRFTLLIGGFLLFGLTPAWAQRQLVDRVVAVINDEAVTQSELELYLRPFYENLRGQYEGEELNHQLNEIRLKLLNQMIEDRLVFQEAKVRGLTVNEGETDAMVEEAKRRFPSEKEFEASLSSQRYSLAELRESFSRQILIRKLHDLEVRSHVVVSPREIEDFYKNRKPELAEEEKIKIRSITLRKSKEAEEKGLSDEAAKQKLESIEKRVRAGESFEALAREFSEDARAKEEGLVGWVRRGETLPAIEENLFKLQAGAVSPLLETPQGYHLFKIEEKAVSQVPSLEEVREKIREMIFREKAEKRFKEWMNQLKARAFISVR